LRFDNRSAPAKEDSAMTTVPLTPRIEPLQPPYDAETEAQLAKWMPPGAAADPLALFRTLFVHPGLAARMRPLGAGILGHGLLDPREREIIVLRTCARCAAEYEWGVHAVAFAGAVGLTEAQIRASARGASDDPAWSQRDRALVRVADELYETNTIGDALWGELVAGWSAAQLLELIVAAGWYRTLSYVINAARVEHEPWAVRFPTP
jgi:4-carboxymuconolactone decarboxylase